MCGNSKNKNIIATKFLNRLNYNKTERRKRRKEKKRKGEKEREKETERKREKKRKEYYIHQCSQIEILNFIIYMYRFKYKSN